MERTKVILLRKIAKLGTIGDVVEVKPGFARNYLFPKKFALRANAENVKYFEARREQIEAENARNKEAAEANAKKIDGISVVLVRQASEKGQLYGSVTARDIAAAIKIKDYSVSANQVYLNVPIKALGVYEISIELHPEVIVTVNLNVAKSEEDAYHQATEAAKEANKNAVALAKNSENHEAKE